MSNSFIYCHIHFFMNSHHAERRCNSQFCSNLFILIKYLMKAKISFPLLKTIAMGKNPLFNTYDARPFSSRNFQAEKKPQGKNRIKLSPNIEEERIESNENNMLLDARCFTFIHSIKSSYTCHHCTSATSLFLIEIPL